MDMSFEKANNKDKSWKHKTIGKYKIDWHKSSPDILVITRVLPNNGEYEHTVRQLRIKYPHSIVVDEDFGKKKELAMTIRKPQDITPEALVEQVENYIERGRGKYFLD